MRSTLKDVNILTIYRILNVCMYQELTKVFIFNEYFGMHSNRIKILILKEKNYYMNYRSYIIENKKQVLITGK